MSLTSDTINADLGSEQRPDHDDMTSGSLAGAPMWGIRGASAAVGLLGFLGFGSVNWALWVVVALAVYLGTTLVVSSLVESRRQATDRFTAALMASAFVVVLMPLISVVWTVIDRGSNRFDWDFYSTTMRGVVGEVAPSVLERFAIEGRVAWLQLDLSEILNGPYGKRSYKRVSKFPSSDMDLAFVVADNVGADKVRNTISKSAGDLLVDLSLVDTYRGAGLDEGTRSLAYRLRLQAADRTLTDIDRTSARDAVIAAVAKHNKGVLRG